MPKPRYPFVRHERARKGVIKGQMLFYFRKQNGPRIRLRGEYGSKEFLEGYRAALNGAAMPQGRPQTAPLTLGWLIARYKASSAWAALSEATQSQRDNIYRHLIRESGDTALADIDKKAIVAGRERRALSAPHQANNFLKSMRAVFRWAVEHVPDCVESDPTEGVRPVVTKSEGYRVWSNEEVSQFEVHYPVGTRERLALDLLLYTGLRRGDVVRLGRQHVRNGAFHIRTEKKGVEVVAPILQPLAQSISASRTGDLAFIVGAKGRPFVKESFGEWFRKACAKAGLTGCTAHGLRKVAATRAAEAGATEAELMALFGWTDAKMAVLYTRKANRARLAAQGSAKVERMR